MPRHRHNGDWLARKLDDKFKTPDGKLDIEVFTEFLKLNEIDMSGKWANPPYPEPSDWPGRYRMNGGKQLRRRIAAVGELGFMEDGKEVFYPVDKDFLKTLRRKHPNVKIEKRNE